MEPAIYAVMNLLRLVGSGGRCTPTVRLPLSVWRRHTLGGTDVGSWSPADDFVLADHCSSDSTYHLNDRTSRICEAANDTFN